MKAKEQKQELKSIEGKATKIIQALYGHCIAAPFPDSDSWGFPIMPLPSVDTLLELLYAVEPLALRCMCWGGGYFPSLSRFSLR